MKNKTIKIELTFEEVQILSEHMSDRAKDLEYEPARLAKAIRGLDEKLYKAYQGMKA